MVALAIIGFLAFIGCIVLLIWSAIKKKTERYWAIGLGVSLVLFMVGAANSTPSTVSKPPITMTRSLRLIKIQSRSQLQHPLEALHL